MSYLIRFAIVSAMRLGKIIGLKWADRNEADRTIIIRDRKHPIKKAGNGQEMPLLGDAFEIVMCKLRQVDRIFPVADGTVSSIFPRAPRALMFEDLRFHNFRHEGVSRILNKATLLNRSPLFRNIATGKCSYDIL